jgi:hypothetical protein
MAPARHVQYYAMATAPTPSISVDEALTLLSCVQPHGEGQSECGYCHSTAHNRWSYVRPRPVFCCVRSVWRLGGSLPNTSMRG